MTNHEKDLLQLQKDVTLKKQLEVKLKELCDQRQIFDQKVIKLRVEHRSEQKDVEKLEGRSLSNYFYQVVGKLDDKLTIERKQATAAKVKLDAAERELTAIDGQLHQIAMQLSDLSGCEDAYAAALEKKYAEVKVSGSAAGENILKIEQRIAHLESQIEEIREAAAVGHSALGTVDKVLSKLDKADGWNTWDIFGGDGIITHMAKYGNLDDAQNLVEFLQEQLRKFKTELADINIQAHIQVRVDDFLQFADYFFDGLFADWAVGDRINESRSAVQSVKRQIERAMEQLSGMEQSADQKIKSFRSKIENIVVKE